MFGLTQEGGREGEEEITQELLPVQYSGGGGLPYLRQANSPAEIQVPLGRKRQVREVNRKK